MKFKLWAAAGAFLLAVVGGLWGLAQWRRCAQDTRKLEFANQLIDRGRAAEAIAVINSRRAWADDSPRARAWLKVSLRALEQLDDFQRLGELYYKNGDLFEEHEEASLLAARAMILRRDMRSFESLRNLWRGREQSSDAWMILEADALLRQGRRAQALALLTENPLQGRWEASRHVRLALLHSVEPAKAWSHLSQAVEADPAQPVSRLFRAQLLEAAGRLDEARLEYVAARLSQPENAALCDQLAEFYRRRGCYELMLDTWLSAQGDARADFLDWKTEFWSRVALPVERGKLPVPAAGRLECLVRLLRSLPEDEFWDQDRLEQYEGAHRVARTRPEVFWLATLQRLHNGEERGALERLALGASVQLRKDLRRALIMTLNYRLEGELDRKGELRYDLPQGQMRHSLFNQLDKLHAGGEQPPAELHRLLRSDYGVPVTLMAAGWARAAVVLQPDSPLPADSPDWAAYGMAQAQRLVNGAPAALEFARRQPQSPALQLLIAELQLEQGQADEARRLLTSLSREDHDIGRRACWLACVSLIEEGSLAQARQWLAGRPHYAETQQGKELLARIALLQGNLSEAERIYVSIPSDSIEARVFLARQAYQAGNFERAEQLTRDLLQDFPADQQLLRSLAAIRQAQQSGAGDPVTPDFGPRGSQGGAQ